MMLSDPGGPVKGHGNELGKARVPVTSHDLHERKQRRVYV
jgi:hypothetical protein